MKRPSTKLLTPAWLVTLLVTFVALVQLVSQPDETTHMGRLARLSILNDRAAVLRKLPDPIQRDAYCIQFCAFARTLDMSLPKDARIFLSGLIGITNRMKVGSYYYLRNYLFPRDVDVSLDGHAVMSWGGAAGVACDSPEVLRKHGFDLQLIEGRDGIFELVELSPKGKTK